MWKIIIERERSQMIKWYMRIACWITKSTNTHTHNMQYLLLFHYNNGCKNAPHCYLIRTFPVLFVSNDTTEDVVGHERVCVTVRRRQCRTVELDCN
jgi:hypothetical protein